MDVIERVVGRRAEEARPKTNPLSRVSISEDYAPIGDKMGTEAPLQLSRCMSSRSSTRAADGPAGGEVEAGVAQRIGRPHRCGVEPSLGASISVAWITEVEGGLLMYAHPERCPVAHTAMGRRFRALSRRVRLLAPSERLRVDDKLLGLDSTGPNESAVSGIFWHDGIWRWLAD